MQRRIGSARKVVANHAMTPPRKPTRRLPTLIPRLHYFAFLFFGWCFGTGPVSTICLSARSNAASSSGHSISLATCSNCGGGFFLSATVRLCWVLVGCDLSRGICNLLELQRHLAIFNRWHGKR